MSCKVYEHDELTPIDYGTGDVRGAPALPCANCHVLKPDQRVARREASVLLAARVDSAVSEIDIHLAELRVALEFLDLTTHGEGAKAVADAEKALGRAWRVVDEVWKECARAVRRGEPSSVAAE
jgi:hypothetical protein